MGDTVEQAVTILQSGGLVALPTETVYGLAANARETAAVQRIFKAKGRPQFNPLIVHVASLEAARVIGDFGPLSLKLAAAFWPGPLTIVVPLKSEARISSLVTAGHETVALRVPAHELMQRVLTKSGLALAAPSANSSGRISPTRAAHVRDDLGSRVDLILDGGETSEGLESTIVKVDEAAGIVTMLRPGTVTAAELEAASGAAVRSFHAEIEDAATGRPEAPGQLLKHYAPRARVRLGATELLAGEALLGFGPEDEALAQELGQAQGKSQGREAFYNLSPSGDLREAARRLYAGLHWLDAQGVEVIAVRPLPEAGVGAALNDRLRRAAAGAGGGAGDAVALGRTQADIEAEAIAEARQAAGAENE